MRPVTVSVGPLAASSPTNIRTASTGTAGALVLNGTLVSGGVAKLDTPRQILFTTVASEAGHTLALTGTDRNGNVQSETVTLPGVVTQNALATSTTGGTLAAATYFYKVTAILPGGETLASNERSIVTTGTTSSNTVSWVAMPGALGYNVYRGTSTGGENLYYGVSGGSTTSFLDTGTAGISATPPASALTNSVLSYATLSSVVLNANSTGNISIGTNSVAESMWVRLDEWAHPAVGLQIDVNGTVNYTVYSTLDDPNSPTNPVAPGSVTWVQSSDSNVVAASTPQQSNFMFAPTFVKVVLLSGSGSVTMTVVQYSNPPL